MFPKLKGWFFYQELYLYYTKYVLDVVKWLQALPKQHTSTPQCRAQVPTLYFMWGKRQRHHLSFDYTINIHNKPSMMIQSIRSTYHKQKQIEDVTLNRDPNRLMQRMHDQHEYTQFLYNYKGNSSHLCFKQQMHSMHLLLVPT